MSKIQLTPTQHAILEKAIHCTDGKIDWFPDNVKGGARKKVLDGMVNRALITCDGDGWRIAAEGYDALGVARPGNEQPAPEFNAELEKDVAAAETAWVQESNTTPRTRENTKQAEVIRMLKRPEGATIRQICDVTGWQAHTVRGTFAGAFKKKFGLAIVSDKAQGGERVYRLEVQK